MHADTLYHRMLEQEKAIEEAKAAGTPIPNFPPIIPSQESPPTAEASSTSDHPAKTLTPDDFSPKVQEVFKDRLKNLSPEERAVEEKAIEMEIAAGQTLGRQLDQLYEERGQNKKIRKEKGQETFSDRISSWFGW